MDPELARKIEEALRADTRQPMGFTGDSRTVTYEDIMNMRDAAQGQEQNARAWPDFQWPVGVAAALFSGKHFHNDAGSQIVPNLAPEPSPKEARRRRNAMPTVPKNLKLEKVR